MKVIGSRSKIVILLTLLAIFVMPLLGGTKGGPGNHHSPLLYDDFSANPYENGWNSGMYSAFEWHETNKNCFYLKATEEKQASLGSGCSYVTFCLEYDYDMPELVDEWDYQFRYYLTFDWNDSQFWFWSATLHGLLDSVESYDQNDFQENFAEVDEPVPFAEVDEPVILDVIKLFFGSQAPSTDHCSFTVTVSEPPTNDSAFNDDDTFAYGVTDVAYGVTDDHVAIIQAAGETPGAPGRCVVNLIN